MRVLRSKFFSSEGDDNSTRTGEVVGTAAVGTAGTVGAAGLAKKGASKVLSKSEGKKAVAEYKEGVSKLMKDKSAADYGAKAKRAHAASRGNQNIVDMIFHKRNVKKADEAYGKALQENKNTYRAAADKLKREVIKNKNARVAKRAGKIGKIALGTGLAVTGLAAGMKARKDKEE